MHQVINGNFDWAYEEELAVSDGWRWSPDGQRLSYWQLHTTAVEWFALVDNTTAAPYNTVSRYPYPKVGTANSTARIGVVSVLGGGTTWMELEPEGNGEHYLARMEWAGPAELLVQRIPRKQVRNDLLLVDAATGHATLLLTDQDDAWVDACDTVQWLDDWAAFTWLSDRSGYRHIYRVSRDGEQLTDLVRPRLRPQGPLLQLSQLL